MANLKTIAEKRDNVYVLNGTKAWITNCGLADWYFVLAKTNFKKNPNKKNAFTGFVVEATTKGVSFGEKVKQQFD